MNESELVILSFWALPLLALCAPWRWTWRIWIAVGALTAAYVALIAFNPSDDILGLREFPATVELVLLLGLLLVVRGLIRAFGLRYPDPGSAERMVLKRVGFWIVWPASAALALVVLRILSWQFDDAGNDHMLHVLFIAGGVLCFLIIAAPIKKRQFTIFVASIGSIASLMVSFAALLSMVTAASVTYSAGSIAGDRTYCILRDPDGEPVTSWRQLVWITNSWPRVAPDFVLILRDGDIETALDWQPLVLGFREESVETVRITDGGARCAEG